VREALDCAVLMTPGHAPWMRDWMQACAGRLGRIRLHVLAWRVADAVVPESPDAGLVDTNALAALGLALKRYDVCLLPVAPASLIWVRTALARASGRLDTPMLALAQDIQAPALEDLFGLGLNDFVRVPVCLDEVRARLCRLQTLARYSPDAPVAVEADCAAAAGLGEPAAGYRAARALRDHIDRAASAPRFKANSSDSFRLAKARVVAGFECAYIHAALSRHQGNVAQAALASSKHRRAFWALMRKHGIEAAPYRQGELVGWS